MEKIWNRRKSIVKCTHHLCEFSVGYGLSSELDVECVSPRYAGRVHETDGTVSVIHNVDVYVTVAVGADAAGDVTLTSL